MNQIDHNAPNLKYQLSIQKEGDLNPGTYIIDNWANNSLEIVSGQSYSPYNVKIQAKNSKGESRAIVQNLTLYSYEESKFTELSTMNIVTLFFIFFFNNYTFSQRVTLYTYRLRELQNNGYFLVIYSSISYFV